MVQKTGSIITKSTAHGQEAGFVGLIVSSAFMKRNFGKRLIEQHLSRWDLTHVIDTSAVELHGHGTPTAILLGRHQPPVTQAIRVVQSKRGTGAGSEAAQNNPVWESIVDLIDVPGSEDVWLSVVDSPRSAFAMHPWSIGGGGASELRETLEENCSARLTSEIEWVGFYQDSHADEAFVLPPHLFRRYGIVAASKPHLRGGGVREWTWTATESIVFPFDAQLIQWNEIPRIEAWNWFWQLRTILWNRSTFGSGTYRSDGRPWFAYHQFPSERTKDRDLIAYSGAC